MGSQSGVVVGPIRLGIREDSDGGPGGRADGGGVGDGGDGKREGLNRWEDTAEHTILRTKPNTPLASAPVLELHHPIMIMLGGNIGRLERE